MNTPFLSNNYIQLHPYGIEHIEKTVEWLKQPFIQQKFGTIEGISIEKHKDWLRQNQDTLKWALHAEQYIGNSFLFVNNKHHSAYFQVYLGDLKDTGKKLGYYATTLILDYAFKHLALHRVWLHCLPENLPAIKLYQRLGFVFEGLERESIFRSGTFITQGRWAILKPEWLARNGAS